MREQGYSYIREEDEDIEKYLNSKRNAYYEYNPAQLEILERERAKYYESYGNNGNAIVENSWQKPVTVTGGLFTFVFTVLTITLAALASPLLVPLAITTLVVGAAATVAVGVSSYDKSRLEKKDNDRTIKRALAKVIKNAETSEQTQAREAKQAAAKQSISPSYPPSVAVPWAASNGNPKAFKSPEQVSDYSRKLTPKELKAKMNVFNKKHIRGYEGAVLKDFYSEITSARAERGAPISLDSLRRTLFCKEKDGRLVNSTLNGGGLNIKNMTPAQRMQVFEIVVNAGNLDDHIVRAGLQKEIASWFEQDKYYGVGPGNKEAVFKMDKADVAARIKICDKLLEAEKTLIDARKNAEVTTDAQKKKAFEQVAEAAAKEMELKKSQMDGFDPNYSGYESIYRENPKAAAKKLNEELSEINQSADVAARAALVMSITDIVKAGGGDDQHLSRAAEQAYTIGITGNSALNNAVSGSCKKPKEIALMANTAKAAAEAVKAIKSLPLPEGGVADNAPTIKVMITGILNAHHTKGVAKVNDEQLDKLFSKLKDGAVTAEAIGGVTGGKLNSKQVAALFKLSQSDKFKTIKNGSERGSTKDERGALVAEAMIDSIGVEAPLSQDMKEFVKLAITGKKAHLKTAAEGYVKSGNADVKEAAVIALACLKAEKDLGDIAGYMLSASKMATQVEEQFKDFSASKKMGIAQKLDAAQKGLKVNDIEKKALETEIKAFAEKAVTVGVEFVDDMISDVVEKLKNGRDDVEISEDMAPALKTLVNVARGAKQAEKSAEMAVLAVGRIKLGASNDDILRAAAKAMLDATGNGNDASPDEVNELVGALKGGVVAGDFLEAFQAPETFVFNEDEGSLDEKDKLTELRGKRLGLDKGSVEYWKNELEIAKLNLKENEHLKETDEYRNEKRRCEEVRGKKDQWVAISTVYKQINAELDSKRRKLRDGSDGAKKDSIGKEIVELEQKIIKLKEEAGQIVRDFGDGDSAEVYLRKDFWFDKSKNYLTDKELSKGKYDIHNYGEYKEIGELEKKVSDANEQLEKAKAKAKAKFEMAPKDFPSVPKNKLYKLVVKEIESDKEIQEITKKSQELARKGVLETRFKNLVEKLCANGGEATLAALKSAGSVTSANRQTIQQNIAKLVLYATSGLVVEYDGADDKAKGRKKIESVAAAAVGVALANGQGDSNANSAAAKARDPKGKALAAARATFNEPMAALIKEVQNSKIKLGDFNSAVRNINAQYVSADKKLDKAKSDILKAANKLLLKTGDVKTFQELIRRKEKAEKVVNVFMDVYDCRAQEAVLLEAISAAGGNVSLLKPAQNLLINMASTDKITGRPNNDSGDKLDEFLDEARYVPGFDILKFAEAFKRVMDIDVGHGHRRRPGDDDFGGPGYGGGYGSSSSDGGGGLVRQTVPSEAVNKALKATMHLTNDGIREQLRDAIAKNDVHEMARAIMRAEGGGVNDRDTAKAIHRDLSAANPGFVEALKAERDRAAGRVLERKPDEHAAE